MMLADAVYGLECRLFNAEEYIKQLHYVIHTLKNPDIIDKITQTTDSASSISTQTTESTSSIGTQTKKMKKNDFILNYTTNFSNNAMVNKPLVTVNENVVTVDDVVKEPLVTVNENVVTVDDGVKEPLIPVNENVVTDDGVKEPLIPVNENVVTVDDVVKEPLVTVNENVVTDDVVKEPLIPVNENVKISRKNKKNGTKNKKIIKHDDFDEVIAKEIVNRENNIKICKEAIKKKYTLWNILNFFTVGVHSDLVDEYNILDSVLTNNYKSTYTKCNEENCTMHTTCQANDNHQKTKIENGIAQIMEYYKKCIKLLFDNQFVIVEKPFLNVLKSFVNLFNEAILQYAKTFGNITMGIDFHNKTIELHSSLLYFKNVGIFLYKTVDIYLINENILENKIPNYITIISTIKKRLIVKKQNDVKNKIVNLDYLYTINSLHINDEFTKRNMQEYAYSVNVIECQELAQQMYDKFTNEQTALMHHGSMKI